MPHSIPVLFGTETGTAEMCAEDVGRSLSKAGYEHRVFDMEDYPVERLPSERLLVILTSTFGDGDPPTNAEALLEHLRVERPDLREVSYLLFALGDSAYPRFVQCGIDFDRILRELGAAPVSPRVDCDGDPEVLLDEFVMTLLAALRADPERYPRERREEVPKKGSWATAASKLGLGR